MLTNRRARFDYDLLEKVEAGLVLTGSEVKSLRRGGGSIAEAYARFRDGEAFIEGATIPIYEEASYNNHTIDRSRKLLLHRREIEALRIAVERRGLTVVPLRLYFKDGRAKVELALGRGRKRHDKRQAIAERDAKREMDRALRGRR